MLPSLLFLSCSKHGAVEKEAEYTVTRPWKTDLDITREYVAQVRAIQHIELRAFERGYLQKILVDEGEAVKKDQKMFEIMPIINEAEYQKSEAEFALAQIEFRNTESLAKKKIVSQNELAMTKAKLDKARAEMNLKKIHLDMTVVKAPFDGLMDRFHARLGSLVEEGELLSTLSDITRMWVYFNVSESDYLTLKAQRGELKATPVKLRLANGQLFDQDGQIDTVEADFNNETGNIAFRASFSNNQKLLRHGETGNILITVPLKDVLVIPQKATFEVLDKKFVYVVDDKNVVKTREVTIQAEVPHLYVISKGLSDTDAVLVDGIAKVHEGQMVKRKIEDSKVVISHLDVPAA